MKEFIQSLNADEVSRVLRELLNKSLALLTKAYDITKMVAGDVDADGIAGDIFCELDALDLDDLSGRAGRTQYGYKEPHEAAWEIFEEVLNPYIYEMKKNQQRALPAIAKIYCIGIIKGLWEYEAESSSNFKDWVTDAPGEYVDTVVEEWKKGNPGDNDIAEVMSVVKGRLSMSGKDATRENRIFMEAVVDANSPEEQAMGWYYYLDDKIDFPFTAECIATDKRIPLELGERVTAVEMSGEDYCQHDMYVDISWKGKTLAVPLSRLKPVEVDEDENTVEAVGDWHYWVNRGYTF